MSFRAIVFPPACADCALHGHWQDALTSAVEALAGQWNVLPSKVVDLALSRRPEFVVDDSFLKIGRVTLPRLARVSTVGFDGFCVITVKFVADATKRV